MCVDASGHVAPSRQDIAVVGTGIAGMTVAFMLGDTHNVTVYETAASPGMDAQSLSLDDGAKVGPRVDVPIRSFSPHYYPNLLALYQSIGVPLQLVNYCTSLFHLGGPCQFQWVNLSVGNYTVPYTNPFTAWRLLSEFVYFQFRCWWWCDHPSLREITFEEFVKQVRVSDGFYEDFLLSVCSVTLSCKVDTVREYPADIVVGFFGKRQTTLLTSWLRVKDGACTICEKLLAKVPQSRRLYNTRVTQVAQVGEKVSVTTQDGPARLFDKVVVATEATHALQMLGQATPDESAILGKFQYEKSTAFVHQDEALMPPLQRDWRTMNLILPPVDGYEQRPVKSENLNKACVNVWMNNLVDVPQGLGNVFQTWNPLVEPKPDSVMARASFQRAVHTVESANTIDRLQDIQGSRGVYFCGSYASRGMTLLEQSVISSLHVADALGCASPWDTASPPPVRLDVGADQDEAKTFASKTPFILAAALAAAPAAVFVARRWGWLATHE
eukprot:TRINITY_DN3148_c0_g1_i1.p1 TRINITY_DN3148_c0_g1~~TRINITY_DN3148_c0_g1_i1.p1  ORF type:complete len:498 (+),score=214.29 TRINITY_DN3148_c0_g1_i1:46-1539(+)